MAEKLIDKTQGLCPQCFDWVDTDVIERQEGIFLRKNCPQHGSQEVFLSAETSHFITLREFYFKTHNEIFPQHRHQLLFTSKCNLACAACFLDSHSAGKRDISVEELKKSFKSEHK